jgi:hypothetical protein
MQLEKFGLTGEAESDAVIIYSNDYPELCSGLKFLSTVCRTAENRDIDDPVIKQSITRLMFMHCIFDKKYISFVNIYGDFRHGSFAQSDKLEELEDYFKSKGFSNEFYDADFRLHKIYPDKQEGSFNVKFDRLSENRLQLNFNIGVPGFRLLMNHFDEMDDELKEFVLSRTKNCDGCGYCTQTDKTGKRKPLTVGLEHKGEAFNKCPLYPALSWNSLDEKAISEIKKLYAFAEDTFYK